MAEAVSNLSDIDWQVRLRGVESLGRLGSAAAAHADSVAACCSATQAPLRHACAHTLGQMGVTSTVSSLAKLLEDTDPDVRRAAGGALGKFGPEVAGQEAAARLQSTNSDIRAAAKQALLNIQRSLGQPPAGLVILRPFIEPSLRDADPHVRRDASQVLERLGAGLQDRTSFGDCAGARLGDPSEEVRIAAIRKLEDLGDNASAQAASLAKCLADDSEGVRLAAVEALAAVGASSAIGAVVSLFNHPLQGVRRAALAVFDQLSSEDARPHLSEAKTAMLLDSDPQTRCEALESLGKLASAGSGKGQPLSAEQQIKIVKMRLDAHWAVRKAAAEAMCHFDAELVLQRHKSDLDLFMSDSDWRVRRSVEKSIGTLRKAVVA